VRCVNLVHHCPHPPILPIRQYRYIQLCTSAHADPNRSQDLKLRYYDLMIQLALQEDAYLEACSAYQEVWDTEEVKKDEAREIGVSCGRHHEIGKQLQPSRARRTWTILIFHSRSSKTS
jgi:hypothetical protein